MNTIDLVVIGVVIISVILAFFRGFVREFLSLSTWVIAIWLGLTLCQTLSDMMSGMISHAQARTALAFFIIFIVVMVIGTIVGYLVSTLIKATPLSGIDRLLGMIFGFVRGVILVALVIVGGQYTEMDQNKSWQQSQFLKQIQPLANWLSGFFPEKELKMPDDTKEDTKN